MSDSPAVAAIVPTRNRADHLGDALESVFEQTYDPIEAIVVDGASTDRTPAVVSRFRESYGEGRITYVRNEEPRGLPAARNQAAERTDAEFLAFLDDDDRWHPTKIERQVAQLSDPASEIGLSYTGRVSETESGAHIHTVHPTLSGDAYRELLVRNVIGSPSRVMVPATVYEAVGGFDEAFSYQEDWDFYIRIARDYPIGCVPAPLVTRRSHREGMSKDVHEQKSHREAVLRRYRSELLAHDLYHAAWSAHHRDTGIEYARTGNTNAGRREFKRALQHEWTADGVILFAFAVLGRRGFQLGARTKRVLDARAGRIRDTLYDRV